MVQFNEKIGRSLNIFFSAILLALGMQSIHAFDPLSFFGSCLYTPSRILSFFPNHPCFFSLCPGITTAYMVFTDVQNTVATYEVLVVPGAPVNPALAVRVCFGFSDYQYPVTS